MAGDLDLPPPGPFLHSGLFRKRTIVEAGGPCAVEE